MTATKKNCPLEKVLVMMPGTLVEAVYATALLSALHAEYPDAHLTVLVKRRLRPVLWGLDSVDRVLSVRKRKRRQGKTRKDRDRVSVVRLGRRLSRRDFDTAIILPNSFRAAALAAVAGIPRRVGYERDGRAVLLTDRLVHRRHRGTYVPVPVLDRYLGIARYVGASTQHAAIEQRVSPMASLRLTNLLRNTSPGIQSDRTLLVDLQDVVDGYADIASHVIQRVKEGGEHPVVIGSKTACAAISKPLRDAGIDPSILQEAGHDLRLLKALIARSERVMSDSAGTLILARALGTPSLNLREVLGHGKRLDQQDAQLAWSSA